MNPADLPSPGFHYGVAFEDYARWPAVNFSTLKPIRSSAAKCRYAMDHPKAPTPAMILGASLHVATLEPARFEQMFFVRPECDRRTKEGKDVYERAMQEAAGRLMLQDGDELALVRDMARAIHASNAARIFLDAAGQNEVSALWRDEETGIVCKGRYDRFIAALPVLQDRPVIVELKTTRDAGEWSFGRDCHVLAYAAQAASYCHGAQRITGQWPAHVFIAVENTPPHDLQLHILNDAGLQTGLLQYRSMLTSYAECVKTGCWPGYPDRVNTLSLPKWSDP